MKENSVLIKERMTVGAHTVDIRRSKVDPARQSIILVHGIGVSSRYFIPLAEQLSAKYHVIAIDLPGYGQTPKPKQTLSVIELADVVSQLTRQLRLDRPILIGHSMGAQIAARAVQSVPDTYKKMILLGPTINVKERSLLMQSLRLFQDTLHEPPVASMIILSDYMHMGFRRYLTTCRYMLRDHIEDSLPDCVLPILIVRGGKDKIVPDDWIRLLESVAPDAGIVEIPGGSHAMQYKMAVPLAQVCDQFISEF